MLNDIEQFILENPKTLDRFADENGKLLEALKQRFISYQKNNDVVSKYLLMTALTEILTVVSDVTKKMIAAQLREKNINIIDNREGTIH